MAISKVILNGDTLMDVTSDTVEAGKLLSNETATKNDGTKVTGNIASKSSTDLSVSGATVTAPAGYYANAVSKAVAAGSAFPPAVTITKAPTIGVNTSGVVTASYNGSSSITPTVNAGYISQGTAGTISTTGTSTYQLTSKAAATYYPSTADQTIASQRWLVGNQTIKSVTTSNLTAENIAEGVVVKVGDSGNASRITQVTGTHSGATSYTATIINSGGSKNYPFAYITYKNMDYYQLNDTFTFLAGDALDIMVGGRVGDQDGIFIDGEKVGNSSFKYTLPAHDIEIELSTGSNSTAKIIFPTLSITENGKYDVTDYARANVNATGEYYGIYKALANGQHIYTGGNTYYSYTAQDVQDYCDSLSSIYNNQFVQRNFVPSGIIFNNVTTIGEYAFGSIYNGTVSGNYRGSLVYSFPSLLSIKEAAFIYNFFIREIYAPVCTSIGTFAFANCAKLETANFPLVTSIGTYAFSSCAKLETANFPLVTSIGTFTFANCRNLTTASFPLATYVGDHAFTNCMSLTTASFPSVTSIVGYAFDTCHNLTTANFPACTTIGSYAFDTCRNLTTASFPLATYVGDHAFTNCMSLTTASFPSVTSIVGYAFDTCRNLTTANFPACTTIGSYAFSGCYNLLSLYLLGSSVPTLANKNVFFSTPISTYTTSTGGVHGSIYVPASLYDSYITATNWSIYSARIVSV